MKISTVTVALVTLVGLHNMASVSPARIMIMTPLGTKSTMLMLKYFGEQLALRGHEIVHFTLAPLTNVTVANLDYVYLTPKRTPFEEYSNEDMFEDSVYTNFPLMYLTFIAGVTETCKTFYEDETIRRRFDASGDFDVILIDPVAQECLVPLVYAKKAPIVLIHANGIDPSITKNLAIPSPFYVPHFFAPPVKEITFSNRFTLSAIQFLYNAINEWIFYPKIDALANVYYPGVPSVSDIYKNASLVLSVNKGVILYTRPATEFFIDITCLPCRPPAPLPEDMEKAIQDSGEHGFMIVATGTFIKTKDISKDFLNAFMTVFAKLNLTVIWQYDGKLEHLPKNVRTYSWLPIQDLLGHPKCKLFFYHGGLYSTYEAIYHGVPMVGLGAFGDQETNILRGAIKGISVYLDKRSVTADSVMDAINTGLTAKYKERVLELSSILRDQMNTALERAIFWIEYVVRHKGTSHLQLFGKETGYTLYYSLDVIACFVILSSAIVAILTFIVKRICFTKTVGKLKTR